MSLVLRFLRHTSEESLYGGEEANSKIGDHGQGTSKNCPPQCSSALSPASCTPLEERHLLGTKCSTQVLMGTDSKGILHL